MQPAAERPKIERVGVTNTLEIMKKLLLLAAIGFFAHANANHVLFNFDNPISFHERGIEFYVFPDGTFDFNTAFSTGGDYYRGNHSGTYGSPVAGGVRIEHDNFGRVRRIGNVFVNYDRNDRVKRIGNVYFNYHGPYMIQAGNMRLIYDRRGNIVQIVGAVKGHSYAGYYQPAYYGPVNTNDYYYYKPDGTKELMKKEND